MKNKDSQLYKGAFAAVIASVVATGVIAEEKSYERVNEHGLKPYTIVDEISIPKRLSDKPGNAANGKKLFVHRKKGNCLTCHTAPIPEQEFHGQVGPDLAGVGERMTAGEIRLRLVDPKRANPDTPMMSFYRTHGLNQVKKSFQGKPMLNEQELEDVIAYLVSLK